MVIVKKSMDCIQRLYILAFIGTCYGGGENGIERTFLTLSPGTLQVANSVQAQRGVPASERRVEGDMLKGQMRFGTATSRPPLKNSATVLAISSKGSSWSPNCHQLAFGGYSMDPLGLWVMDIRTQDAIRVAKGRYTSPAWSKDGSKLSFGFRGVEPHEIWVIETSKLAVLRTIHLNAESTPGLTATSKKLETIPDRDTAVRLAREGRELSEQQAGAINQDALSEELLDRASALDPNNPEPAGFRVHFYRNQRIALMQKGDETLEERRVLARKSLKQAKRFVDLTTGDRSSHMYASIDAAKEAIDAETFDDARHFATDLLRQVTDPPESGDGQAFHDGHVVLGLVALHDGDVEQAKGHLLQAGRAPGDGTLTSFGPNMSLAKALAERGEYDTVIAYLELCRSFWQRPRLEKWIQTLKEGKVPDFGTNLIY